MACRETELVGKTSRTVKEAVAASVSVLNQCSFCVDAHTVMLNATGSHAIADAIGKGHYEKIPDSKIRAIVNWAVATRSPGNEILQSPPFLPDEAPEIVGTAVFYHYINRMATIFLSGTPLPSNNVMLKNPMKRVAGLMFQKAVRQPKGPGESLEFLPYADLPMDMEWAKDNPMVAQAFARFARVIQDLGESVLSQDARDLVLGVLDRWNGEELLNVTDIEDETGTLIESERGAARLALLAALAPQRITEGDILGFRKQFPYATSLLGTTAWASFAVARRIGNWVNANRVQA
jgi:AhpD family alkylhydroperoxidase